MAESKAPPPSPPAAAPTKAVAKTVPKEHWTQAAGKDRLESLAPLVIGTINRALPKFMANTGDRLVRCAVTACVANDYLLKCSPISIFAGVVAAAQLGLEIGGPRGEAYLVPYTGKATLQIGYRGFLQLGYRSSMLKRCAPVDVRQNDIFKVFGGTGRRILHEPFQGPNNKAGKVIAYYCITELTNGGDDFEYMYVSDAIEFRDRFASGRDRQVGPWYKPAWPEPDGEPSQEFNEMAKKTLIRKLFKRLPISAEAQTAAALDEYAEAGIAQRLPEIYLPEIDYEPTGVEALENKIANRGTSPPTSPPSPPPPPTAAKEAAGESAIAKLLKQVDTELGDDRWTAEWMKATGYEGLDQIEMLSETKRTKLAKDLRDKVVELGAEPVA